MLTLALTPGGERLTLDADAWRRALEPGGEPLRLAVNADARRLNPNAGVWLFLYHYLLYDSEHDRNRKA